QRVGDSRLCLYREDSTHSIREHVREGDMLPIDKGSAGHILLHFGAGADEKQRRKVFARLPIATFGERDAGAASISAPIFGAGDVLLGALSISGPRSRLTRERIRELCESLVTAARELSEKLGGGACWRDKA
ncbi:MAG: IclR family transcriptional regulator C-terminal domain-containing protein, partial [Caulobacterales bacterium]